MKREIKRLLGFRGSIEDLVIKLDEYGYSTDYDLEVCAEDEDLICINKEGDKIRVAFYMRDGLDYIEVCRIIEI